MQRRAHLLQLLNRDDDAIQLLARPLRSAERAGRGQLYSLLSENGRWSEAERALERFEELSPLIESPLQNGSQPSEPMPHHLGKREDAARLAKHLDDPFHKQFTEKLAALPSGPDRATRRHLCPPAFQDLRPGDAGGHRNSGLPRNISN
jgi:hypothetical protein